jgi:DNA repair protein RecN (Recombination protein N)
MLEYMHVRNLALIKECEISFDKGLNILTGETGAGKSILLGSINLALGAKADKDIIRTGEEEAYVELVFSANEEIKALLNEMEISSEDSSVCISRKITPTKTVFKINGEIVPAKQVKELAGGLIDIHGQHEHQSLLSNNKQRDMLDAFGGTSIEEAKKSVVSFCKEYNRLKSEYDKVLESSSQRERQISLLRYEIDEIINADLKVGEDEELEADFKRMQASERILSSLNEAMAIISEGSGNDVSSMLSRAISAAKKVTSLDEEAATLEDSLIQCEEFLGDFMLDAANYMERLEFSPEDFERVEERLNTINSLKLKFGNRIEDILSYLDEKSEELSKLENLEEYLSNLKADLDKAFSSYKESALKLSSLRKSAAKELSKLLSGELMNLNFLDSRFEVNFDTNEELVSENGFDNIDFLISTNPGEPLKPMKNVSSGGELSRIMLAMKTILAKKDSVDALIFDEIDAGISGKTAWEVSGRLSKLSKEHQVILITHLAQIAAFSDRHFEIKKAFENGATTTTINKLDENGEIEELSRLLGFDEENAATKENAKELKRKANERKNM